MIIPVLILLLGVLCGRFFIPVEITGALNPLLTAALGVVVLCAGIVVGCKKTVFHQLRSNKRKMLLVPVGTVIGTLAGGLLAGRILGMPVNESTAVAAGCGYYSMAVGLFTEMGASHLAALAFLSNNLREIFSLIFIPFVAKYISYPCAVAVGGCTTMDVTLPIISRSTNEEITIIAMVNGIVLSIIVPILIPLLYSML